MPSITDKATVRINDALMAIDTKRPLEQDPKLHVGLNPVLLTMSHELQTLQWMNTRNRKAKIRKLLVEDFLQEDRELREVESAYINTQI